MRSYVFPVALCALLATANVEAQGGGMLNQKSPMVTQSIAFANGASIELKYKSLTWGSGASVENVAKGDAEKFTARSASSPLGSATVTQGVTLGDQSLAAGEYKLYFGRNDAGWTMVMEGKDGAKHVWPLALKAGDKMNTRLTLALSAGEKDTDARLMVAFGKESCTVGCSAGAEKSAEKSAAKPGKD